MELWIRSQDRTFLRKVNTIGIVEGRDFWSIDESLTVSFGKFKTKERALEVLDEINGILQLKLCTTLGTFEEVFKGYTEKQIRLVLKQMAVYEMPKE